MKTGGRVVALSGGVGGAKLASGLASLLGARLTVIVNTGDDFEHLGLSISPDIDSVLYALAGLNDEKRGWGRGGETWACMEELARLGEESWFQLGDRDLAMHVARSHGLASGRTLSAVTAGHARSLGIEASILPMSDDPVRTTVHTDDGPLSFQHYFVKHQCRPVVRGMDFEGAEDAAVSGAALAALREEGLEAIVLCPSNPYLSIDPILALPGMRDALSAAGVPVVAVSPLVGGKALKGPAAKLLEELGGLHGNAGVVRKYDGLIDGLVIDAADEAEASELGVPVLVTHTVMSSEDDRRMLAQDCLSFSRSLRGKRP